MLKLAQEPVYADAIKLEQFQTMALLASVSHKCYVSALIPHQFNLSSICFLTGLYSLVIVGYTESLITRELSGERSGNTCLLLTVRFGLCQCLVALCMHIYYCLDSFIT